ncbi:hypothetical protein BDN72DRAFT_527108 [Pluteus cervinus]|uniref:Uncharacterized protein n=1 Tax=Pluteus cervinus TaxID=181527 RepID=A0ACD3A6I2_9AGAR|nr:hypothetical protein BDN72DRAFT_527108 [Pluteus cervinus]
MWLREGISRCSCQCQLEFYTYEESLEAKNCSPIYIWDLVRLDGWMQKKWTGVAAGPFGQELLNPNLNLNSTGGRKNFFAFFFCFCVCSRFLLAFAPSRNQKCLPSRRHCSCLQ